MAALLSPLRRFYAQAYLAVTDFDFYKSIYRQSLPRTFLYFALLALHVAAAAVIHSAWTFLPTTSRLADWVERTFPVVHVRGGQLSVEGDLPLVIENPEDRSAAVFVEEGQAPPTVEGATSVMVLTPRHGYVLGQEDRTFEWSWLPDQSLPPADLAGVIRLARWFSLPFLFGLFVLLFLIPRAAEGLIFSLFGYSANARFKRRWRFARFYTIAIYGLTPAILVEQLGRVLGLTGIVLHLIYLATAGIYVYVGTSRALLSEPPSSTA